MNDQDQTKPLPLSVLLIGFFLMAAIALWCGSRFFLHNASVIFGVIGGICVGGAYAFGKQLLTHYINKDGSPK